MREKRQDRCYFRGRLLLCLLALLFASCYGSPESLDLKASKGEIHANGEETLTVTIRAVDDKSRTVKNAEIPVEVSVSGADVLMIEKTPVTLEEGRKDLTFISTFEAGDVKITANFDGLKGGETTFTVIPDYRDGDGDGWGASPMTWKRWARQRTKTKHGDWALRPRWWTPLAN